QTNNIKKTIATASEITNVKFFNDQFGLDRWFDINKIVFDDWKIAGKPAPDMFLKAAENIGVNPSNCIVFEDSATGITAAKNAGISKVIIIDPSAEKSKFLNHPDVDQVIPDFTKFNTALYL
ncbi:MAG: HAD family phosphatase, partial [Cyclobacteriaceae bacterium]|nr:HAD family phosphatase [Cyclobacteriaceae bacterium]